MKASRGEVPTSAPALTQTNKGKKMAQADSTHTTKTSALIHDPLTNRTHESNTGGCGGLSSISRRTLVNSLVILPVVAAMPLASPAASMLLAPPTPIAAP